MRILLAVDGSAPSQDAIDEIVKRTWPASSTSRVISVVRPYVPPATEFVAGALTPQDVLHQQEKDAQQIAAGAAQRLTHSSLSVDTVVRQGDPRTVIVDEAAEWGADLIVVGSHGHTGLTRLLLGSVARRLSWPMRHARLKSFAGVARSESWKVARRPPRDTYDF